MTRDKRRCRVGDDKLGGRHSNDGLVDGAEGGHPNLGCHVLLAKCLSDAPGYESQASASHVLWRHLSKFKIPSICWT